MGEPKKSQPLPWDAATYRNALLELLRAAKYLQPYRASPPEYPGMVLVPLEDVERLNAHVTGLGNPDDYAYPLGWDTPETRRLRKESHRVREAIDWFANAYPINSEPLLRRIRGGQA